MSQAFLKFVQRGATVEVADAVAADPALIHWRDTQGVSALMWSIYSGQILVRDFLLVELERTGATPDIFEAAATGNVTALGSSLDRKSVV